jgi:hypothetical protein
MSEMSIKDRKAKRTKQQARHSGIEDRDRAARSKV